MKTYRVRFTRDVVRQVEIKQEAFAYIEALDENTARKAAREIAHDQDEQDEHLTEWEEVFRLASDDEPVRGCLDVDHDLEPARSSSVPPASATKLLGLGPQDHS